MGQARTGVSDSDLALHTSGDTVTVGDIPITLMHTPGHTPGSQCFLVDGKLVAGDTLFLDGCGRTDLPGARLRRRCTRASRRRLAVVPDDTILYPGHLYSRRAVRVDGRYAPAQLRVPRPDSLEQWRMFMGG